MIRAQLVQYQLDFTGAGLPKRNVLGTLVANGSTVDWKPEVSKKILDPRRCHVVALIDGETRFLSYHDGELWLKHLPEESLEEGVVEIIEEVS